jgi:uncharacterized phage protein gp47/JayE
MQLSFQTFSSLVQNMAAGVQSSASQLLDMTAGSVTRSLLEANASVALWMQWLILQVLQSTRAATSTGQDLDSWMADMTLTRLPAVPASGRVVFSRFTPLAPAFIPVGALVRTADGLQTFAVTAETSNPTWIANSNGYSIGAGIASLSVPISAQTAGQQGNVQAGSITLMATAIPGIDTVVNPAPLENGLDAEPDTAFRARFQNFVQTRSRATPLAVINAINGIQQGLVSVVQENMDAAGNPRLGSFVVTVDDGSGTPSSNLLSLVSTAVEAVRPLGSSSSVQGPTVITANVALTISPSTGVDKTQMIQVITSAITSYINASDESCAACLRRFTVGQQCHPNPDERGHHGYCANSDRSNQDRNRRGQLT